MTPQQTALFDQYPVPLPVRSSDPETSKRAARDLPIRPRQQECLIALRHMIVSVTADQVTGWLHAEAGLKTRQRNEVSSRLRELERMGLVHKVGVRKNHRNITVATWGPTRAGREAAR